MYAFHSMIEFIVIGALGGVTRALMQARRPQDLTKFDALKILGLGPIAGYVYFLMVNEWNAPDHVVAFFFAYAFIDIVDRLARLIISIGKKSVG